MEEFKKGPFSYRNWKSHIADQPLQLIFEYPLFTDVWIVGEIDEGLGPYQIINNLRPMSVLSRPALILRVRQHFLYDISMDKTSEDHYHGGTQAEEIAALLSLCLGVRMKAGEETRMFGNQPDWMGRPTGGRGAQDPIPLPRTGSRGTVLPLALRSPSLKEAELLRSFPVLSLEHAIALVRAARMYQEAVWICDFYPELSWLMLTSAVETLAQSWRRTTVTPLEKMRSSRPELEHLLKPYGDELVMQVAEQVAPYMGATKTFLDFILTFLPPPPASRCGVGFQLNWERTTIKQALDKIYKYRSRALHEGHPFPAPICEPPVGDSNEFAERPAGLASSMKGGAWLNEDLPMYLQTFEYIGRHAILNWWKSVVSENKQDTKR
jgi:hypothetical protein